MDRVEALREKMAALRAEQDTLRAALARAEEREALGLRRRLAEIGEDLVDAGRELRQAQPRHTIRRGRTWAGLEGWQWDALAHKTWEQLEGEEEPRETTPRARMAQALEAARGALTPQQRAYLAAAGEARQGQIAREAGVCPATVSRTLQRGKRRLAERARGVYTLLEGQEGGDTVIDLARPEVLSALLSALTGRQQICLYLYYGEWLSLREIGALLGVCHTSVLRALQRGLRRIEALALGAQVEVRGLDALEERLIAHFSSLPPEEPPEGASRPPRRPSPARPDTPAAPRAPEPPVTLRQRLVRFVRGSQTREVDPGASLAGRRAAPWGSGRLLSLLRDRAAPAGLGAVLRLLGRLFAALKQTLKRSTQTE